MSLGRIASRILTAGLFLFSTTTVFADDGPRRRLNPLEAQFAAIERSVPGFAGWYLDKEGNAIVRMKGEARKAEAMERVARILETRKQSGRGRSAQAGRPQVKAQPARYSFSELARFRDAVSANLPDGVHSIDLDEVNNTITIGVIDDHAVQRFRGVAAKLGLPGAALRVDVTPKPEARLDLKDYNRPVSGGVQHTWNTTSTCTVGVNAQWSGSSTYAGYMTASHCSAAAFSLGSSTYYQPTLSTANLVGYEWDDPSPSTSLGGCASGRACRWSDSLFVIYDSTKRSAANAYNTIAETTYWSNGSPGSTTWSGYDLTIVDELASTPTNDWLEKIGITTGWTYGQVDQTCVDLQTDFVDSSNRPIWLLCNEVTDIHSWYGDSGSPIFKWLGNREVEWGGILWGGPVGDADHSYHASNWNVTADLTGYDFYY